MFISKLFFNKNKYIKSLSKRLFWDIDINKLNYKKDRQIIIERIAVFGTENDEKIMNILYSQNIIKKFLIKSDSLNEKVIQYYSFILRITENKFKCYTRTHAQMSF